MADVNRGNRPLSPHLQIYRPQITSMVSIIHRITGIGMSVSLALIVWWFVAAANSGAYFALVDWVLASWFGCIILTLSLWGLWFHMLNGIRHLVWDTGRGFDLAVAHRSGWAVIAGSVLLTLITIVLV